jgi:hypothetical protein
VPYLPGFLEVWFYLKQRRPQLSIHGQNCLTNRAQRCQIYQDFSRSHFIWSKDGPSFQFMDKIVYANSAQRCQIYQDFSRSHFIWSKDGPSFQFMDKTVYAYSAQRCQIYQDFSRSHFIWRGPFRSDETNSFNCHWHTADVSTVNEMYQQISEESRYGVKLTYIRYNIWPP